MKPKIKLENISKSYQMYSKQSDKLLDLFVPGKKKQNKNFHALKEVSFEIYEGETVGVVGINGSGKSTLSNLLAEVVPPTSGSLQINGETSLIAINAGLNKQLSGVENIELKCLMLGFSKEEIQEVTPKIKEFADIGSFINQPVKNYSSGMKSRLGFAISAFTHPDILIVDEALSVGDKTFYQKCIDKIDEFKAEGKTILFISHSISQMRSISDRVIWLHHGQVKEFGQAEETLDNYESFINWFNELSKEEKVKYKQTKMLEQSKKPSAESRKAFSKKRRSIWSGVQIILLFLLTVLSGLYMFVENTSLVISLSPQTEKTTVAANDQEEETVQLSEKINKNGIVMAKDAALYNTTDSMEEIKTIDITTQVYVMELLENRYKLRVESQTGYMDKDDIVLLDETSSKEDVELSELIPLFPQTTVTSFEFFFNHLGLSYGDITNKLRGISQESTENGNKKVAYVNYNLSYVFNESDIAETLILTNINVDQSVVEKLQDKAKATALNGNIFYLSTANFNFLINIENQVIEIKLKEMNE